MKTYSITEIITQAVQTEKLGYEFYTKMANRFNKNKDLKEFFETLAMKELSHEKIFSELMDESEGQMIENMEEVSFYLRAIVESEFFLGKNKSLPSLEHLKTIDDVVHYATCFEKDTLLYFFSLRDIVKEKEIIDEIIREEKSHIVWLSEFIKTFV